MLTAMLVKTSSISTYGLINCKSIYRSTSALKISIGKAHLRRLSLTSLQNPKNYNSTSRKTEPSPKLSFWESLLMPCALSNLFVVLIQSSKINFMASRAITTLLRNITISVHISETRVRTASQSRSPWDISGAKTVKSSSSSCIILPKSCRRASEPRITKSCSFNVASCSVSCLNQISWIFFESWRSTKRRGLSAATWR